MNNASYVEECNAIREVLSKYNEGCAKADSSILKSSFDEQATIFGLDSEGNRIGGHIQWMYDALDNNLQPSPNAQAAVARIEIVGNAASARVDTDDLVGARFTDFFNLLKIEGKWTVMSKVYHTHN